MYTQLPDNDYFRGFDFPNGDLTAISRRIYEGFAIPPWLTSKHHIISMRVPKKLPKRLRETTGKISKINLRQRDYFGE